MKTIYVSNRLDPNDEDVKIAESHEMVHFLQDINGKTKEMANYISCTESEAYDVQGLWMKDHNVKVGEIGFVFQQSMLQW